jgi:hypothetical protein
VAQGVLCAEAMSALFPNQRRLALLFLGAALALLCLELWAIASRLSDLF